MSGPHPKLEQSDLNLTCHEMLAILLEINSAQGEE